MKKLTLLFLFLAFGANAAEVKETVYQWRSFENGNVNAYTVLTSKPDDKGKVHDRYLFTEISVSQGGAQRIYFNMYDIGKNTCTEDGYDYIGKDESRYKEQTWRINGKNVRMSAYCDKDGDLSATPKTYQGLNFVANTFSKSNKNIPILIKTYDFTQLVHVGTFGFSKAWKSFGGDAI